MQNGEGVPCWISVTAAPFLQLRNLKKEKEMNPNRSGGGRGGEGGRLQLARWISHRPSLLVANHGGFNTGTLEGRWGGQPWYPGGARGSLIPWYGLLIPLLARG